MNTNQLQKTEGKEEPQREDAYFHNDADWSMTSVRSYMIPFQAPFCSSRTSFSWRRGREMPVEKRMLQGYLPKMEVMREDGRNAYILDGCPTWTCCPVAWFLFLASVYQISSLVISIYQPFIIYSEDIPSVWKKHTICCWLSRLSLKPISGWAHIPPTSYHETAYHKQFLPPKYGQNESLVSPPPEKQKTSVYPLVFLLTKQKQCK